MNGYIISAIIGFYRMGASNIEMSYATEMPIGLIEKVIKIFINNQTN